MGIASLEAFLKWLLNPDSVLDFVSLLDLPSKIKNKHHPITVDNLLRGAVKAVADLPPNTRLYTQKVYMVYCKGHMSFDCAACPFMEKKHVRGGGERAP